jgi:hypothetical protein
LLEIKGFEDDTEIVNFFLKESKIVRDYYFDTDLYMGSTTEFKTATLSYNSFILRASNVLDYFQNTIVWEQFFNGSAKFHFPIPYCSNQKNVIDEFKKMELKYENDDVFSKFTYCDGIFFIRQLIPCLGSYFNILKKIVPNFNEIAIVIDLNHVQNHVLFFDLEEYRHIIQEKGLIFSDKEKVRIDLTNPIIKIEEKQILFYFMLIYPIFRSLGYSSKDFVKLLLESMKKS